MPTTLPGISVTQASRLLQSRSHLEGFPEVDGSCNREAETPTDRAFSMMETTVMLKRRVNGKNDLDKLVEEMDRALRSLVRHA